MKFSAALSLALAPVALGKIVHSIYPDRRDTKAVERDTISKADLALLEKTGLALGSLNEIIVIWVNGGGDAATTTINAVSTVTQTVTAGVAGAAAAGTSASTTAAITGTTTAAALGATHTVTVGGPKGLIYEPSSISASVGDMVIFTFLSQNHTVSQSSFATPCELLAGGMDSGFQPNPNNTVNPPPQVALQVMVDTPLWFYCRQQGHCGKGMVFSINPTANKTQALFQEAAIAQNGTSTGSAITGNGGTTAAAGSGTTTSASSSTSTGTAAAASATTGGTGLTTGTGTINADGSCSCAVICDAGSFPAVQAQGLGAFGGFGGALPSTAVVA